MGLFIRRENGGGGVAFIGKDDELSFRHAKWEASRIVREHCRVGSWFCRFNIQERGLKEDSGKLLQKVMRS